ncbi:TetR/AcrR family transcriptional regulator [Shewanella electrodiphila]|uniref:TetR/AcrR family transcriptional regulator n=1 Tax=Shewanella electrodiphila TaxID=934143 RepID=A0ABT0KLR4_9GAMM|nr:TetR/AcrR family transcriptional regulator [Shewanella electrodiphila]MCL1044766.1 TetR/AcrR family transcriptional regulator [Shewanella electrodiphila]
MITAKHSTLCQHNAPKTRSEQKCAQILQSAIELFCVQGFPNTSMDLVAKKAGVSKQTVYSHFGSKDELFIAAIESKCVVHQLTGDLLEDSTNAEQTIRTFATQFGELIVSEEVLAVFKTCLAHADTHPDLSKLYFDAGPKHVLGLLSDYFSRVNKHDELYFAKPHDSAVRLCLMLFGELKMRLELGLDVSDLVQNRQSYIEDTVSLFLNAHRK